jgi:hypothetical protein
LALGVAAGVAAVAAIVPVATADGTGGPSAPISPAAISPASPPPGDAGPGGGPLQQVRDATRHYRNVDSAIDAGYVQFFGCVHEPLAGSMGIHFVNGALAGDTTIDPARPEALTYEVEPNGQLSLAGAEYIVFQDAWDARHDQPPSLFGKPFTLVPSPNR